MASQLVSKFIVLILFIVFCVTVDVVYKSSQSLNVERSIPVELSIPVDESKAVEKSIPFDESTPDESVSRSLTVDPCFINCRTGQPCEYPSEVGFRIIVMTYNRPESLHKCLSNVIELDTLGHEISVHIWIDRSSTGQVDNETVDVAMSFSSRSTRFPVCVHLQESHAGIRGQWIDTWHPKEGTNEMCLILEDDIDISPLVYKWLRNVDKHYKDTPEVAAYTLQMENVKTKRGHYRHLSIPSSELLYLYRATGTWGMSPKPAVWRKFQEWYHVHVVNASFHPYVPDIVSTRWFKRSPSTVWEMWFTFYCWDNNLFTLYANLVKYSGNERSLLDTNRKEAGLHYREGRAVDNCHLLLSKWNSSFETVPTNPRKYDYDAEEIKD